MVQTALRDTNGREKTMIALNNLNNQRHLCMWNVLLCISLKLLNIVVQGIGYHGDLVCGIPALARYVGQGTNLYSGGQPTNNLILNTTGE